MLEYIKPGFRIRTITRLAPRWYIKRAIASSLAMKVGAGGCSNLKLLAI